MQGFEDYLKHIQSGIDPEDNSTVLPEALQDDLRNRYAALLVEHEFKAGDLVRTKQCLEDHRRYAIVYAVGKEYVESVVGGTDKKTEPMDDMLVLSIRTHQVGISTTWSPRWEPWPDEGGAS